VEGKKGIGTEPIYSAAKPKKSTQCNMINHNLYKTRTRTGRHHENCSGSLYSKYKRKMLNDYNEKLEKTQIII
jgi:hypothetical protein